MGEFGLLSMIPGQGMEKDEVQPGSRPGQSWEAAWLAHGRERAVRREVLPLPLQVLLVDLVQIWVGLLSMQIGRAHV